MSCRICGSQSFNLWIDQGSLQIYRCGACGYGAIEPLPVPVDLDALYGKDYFEGGGVGYPGYMLEEPVHRWQARRNLKVLHAYCRPGPGPGPKAPHLLDVGCAAGFFLDDYETGRREGRYLAAALPSLPFPDTSFELALCSHLLLFYAPTLPLEFHLAGVQELCRVAQEVRIFPLVDFNGARSPYLGPLLRDLERVGLRAEVVRVPYEFQRGGDRMLRIRA
jgi:SAM-dependent methyltransferase